ncbi:MAG: hypothetical protein IK053_05280 [Muribaculaceae bacterium]|nr:hypothetical protein [Muribaculaceae bacterium]
MRLGFSTGLNPIFTASDSGTTSDSGVATGSGSALGSSASVGSGQSSSCPYLYQFRSTRPPLRTILPSGIITFPSGTSGSAGASLTVGTSPAIGATSALGTSSRSPNARSEFRTCSITFRPVFHACLSG